MKYDDLSMLSFNFIAIGFAIIAVYFHSRLKKSGELREINSHFIDIKRQQVELEKATSEIKQTLKLSEIKYQVKMGKYHEKQIESTDAVYKSIVELRDAVRDLAFTINDDTKRSFVGKLVLFRNNFDLNRIWLDKNIAKQIGEFALELDKKADRHIRNEDKGEKYRSLSAKQLDKVMDEQDDFYDFIYKEVNEKIDVLVSNIVSTLSAET